MTCFCSSYSKIKRKEKNQELKSRVHRSPSFLYSFKHSNERSSYYVKKLCPLLGLETIELMFVFLATMIIPFAYVTCQLKYRTIFRGCVAIYIKLCVDL